MAVRRRGRRRGGRDDARLAAVVGPSPASSRGSTRRCRGRPCSAGRRCVVVTVETLSAPQPYARPAVLDLLLVEERRRPGAIVAGRPARWSRRVRATAASRSCVAAVSGRPDASIGGARGSSSARCAAAKAAGSREQLDRRRTCVAARPAASCSSTRTRHVTLLLDARRGRWSASGCEAADRSASQSRPRRDRRARRRSPGSAFPAESTLRRASRDVELGPSTVDSGARPLLVADPSGSMQWSIESAHGYGDVMVEEQTDEQFVSFGEQGAQLTYGSYLRLPQLLDSQHLESDPPAHDELLFITIHQVYELWFQQLLHEAAAARDAMIRRRAVVGPAPAEPGARDRAGAGAPDRRAGDDDAAGLPGVPAAARAGQRLPVGAVPRAGVPLRRQGPVVRRPVPRADRGESRPGSRSGWPSRPCGTRSSTCSRQRGLPAGSDDEISASLRTARTTGRSTPRSGRSPRRCSSTTSSPPPGGPGTWSWSSG